MWVRPGSVLPILSFSTKGKRVILPVVPLFSAGEGWAMGGGAEGEKGETDSVSTPVKDATQGQGAVPARRPWHAPHLMLSDIGLTDRASSPVASDGTPVSQFS
jgi:hypothetical protein